MSSTGSSDGLKRGQWAIVHMNEKSLVAIYEGKGQWREAFGGKELLKEKPLGYLMIKGPDEDEDELATTF